MDKKIFSFYMFYLREKKSNNWTIFKRSGRKQLVTESDHENRSVSVYSEKHDPRN